MKAALIVGLSLTIATGVVAATNKVKIPKQGWAISFDSPPLEDREKTSDGGDFSFFAGAGSLTVSFYVEEPKGTGNTHRACYEFYWSRADQDRFLQRDTVSTTETEKFVRVQYDSIATVAGYTLRSKNVRYFFTFRGKWVDVHISVPADKPDGDRLIAAFDKSLSYGP